MLVTLTFKYVHRLESIDEIFALKDMRRDLTLTANNDNKLKLRLFTGRFFKDGININGWTFYLTIKDYASQTDGVTGATAVLEKNITDLTEPNEGKTDVMITREECENLEGSYLYSIKYKTDTDRVDTLCYGIVNFIRELSTRIN